MVKVNTPVQGLWSYLPGPSQQSPMTVCFFTLILLLTVFSLIDPPHPTPHPTQPPPSPCYCLCLPLFLLINPEASEKETVVVVVHIYVIFCSLQNVFFSLEVIGPIDWSNQLGDFLRYYN